MGENAHFGSRLRADVFESPHPEIVNAIKVSIECCERVPADA
jgi:hypothetical protein